MARILVVDDEEQVRKLLRLALEGAGHQVSECANGVQALRAQRQRPAELVFCDLFMPEMDGLELMHILHRESPGLPIIAISGGGFGGSLNLLGASRTMGACATLDKPFSPSAAVVLAERALAAAKGCAQPARQEQPEQFSPGKGQAPGRDLPTARQMKARI